MPSHPRRMLRAWIAVLAFAVFAFPAHAARVVTAPDAIPGEYIVVLGNIAPAKVSFVASDIARKSGGEVLAVWEHALRGFWIRMPDAKAAGLLDDPRVASVEQNAPVYASGSQATGRGGPCYPRVGGQFGTPDAQQQCIEPSPAGNYEDFPASTPRTGSFQPHPLWYLARISRRSADPRGDFTYRYSSTGDGVKIYVVDAGVLRYHQEFYPEGVSEQQIRYSVLAGNRSLTSRVTNGYDAFCRRENETAPCTPAASTVEVPPNAGGLDIDQHPPSVPHSLQVRPAMPPEGPDLFDLRVPSHIYFRASLDGQPSLVPHGVAVAALAAGRVGGVAKDAVIVPVKVNGWGLRNRGSSVATVIAGLDWIAATATPPSVVTMSTFRFTERQPDEPIVAGTTLSALESAIGAVIEKGIPIVTSANNQGVSACITTPARLSRRGTLGKVISVGGLAKNSDTRWPLSNYGACVDIWAPAELIPVANTTRYDRYRQPDDVPSGTSYAAPMVAGTIAKMLDEDPSLYENVSPAREIVENVWSRLAENATRIELEESLFVQRFGAASPKLIVYSGPFTIVDEPDSFEFNASQTVTTLRATILAPEDSDGQFHAQWYRVTGDGQPGEDHKSETIGTAVNLIIPDPARPREYSTTLTRTSAQPGTYWARISGNCPGSPPHSCSVDTTGARLESDRLSIVPGQSVHWVRLQYGGSPLVRQPVDVPVTFTVDGKPGAYSYQWFRGTTAISSCDSAGVNVTSSTHTISCTIPAVNGNADVHVNVSRDGGAFVQSPSIALQTCVIPRITSIAPAAAYFHPGAGQLFRLTVPDAADFAIQWFRSTESNGAYSPVPGATGAELTTTNTNAAGYYKARVYTSCPNAGTSYVESVAVELRICTKPVISGQSAIVRGQSVTLTATVPGEGPTTFVWYEQLEGAAGATLIATTTTNQLTHSPQRNASYLVETRNVSCSNQLSETLFHVTVVQIDITHPVSVTADRGASAQLHVSATGPAGATLTFEWYERQGQTDTLLAGGSDYTITSTTNASTLTIRNVRRTATYFAKISLNGVSLESNTATVTCRCTIRRRAASHSTAGGPGSPVSLWVEDDHDGVSFEWFEGTDTSDRSRSAGTGASIVVDPLDTTSYYALMTVICGTDSATEVTDPITVSQSCDAPVIQNQPADNAVIIPASGGVTLSTSVGVSGMGPFAYQWYEVSDGGAVSAISGADASSYSFTAPLGADGRVVSVRRTVFVRVFAGCDPSKYADSNRATLSTVDCEVPRIFGFSGGGLLDNPGESIPLSVVMDPPESADVSYTYEWFRGDGRSIGGNSSTIHVSTGKMDTFYVRVAKTCSTDPLVKAVVTSPKAYVWVYGTCDLPPLYVGQSATVLPIDSPGTVTFTAFCDWRNIDYQWYRGQSGDTRHPVSSDAGKAHQYTTQNMGAYWVRASLDCGAHRDSGTLTFSRGHCSPVIITRQPQSATTARGQEVPVSVSADSSPHTLSYNWYEEQGSQDIAIPNATGPTLRVAPMKSTRYYAKIGNTSCGGAADTMLATVRVATCGTIDVDPWPNTETWIDHGTRATLTVAATSPSALSYQWYAGEVGDESGILTGQTTATLLTEPSTSEAKYWVRVTNADCLVDSPTITVKLCERPAILGNYQRNLNIVPGQNTWLAIDATGTGLTYQWYQGAVDDESRPVGRGVDAMRVNPQVTTRYWVKVTGHCGVSGQDVTVQKSGTITVSVCPSITTAAAAAQDEVMPGTTTTLSLEASGSELTYAWYRGSRNDISNAVLLEGSNSASIETPPITADTTFFAIVKSGGCQTYSDEVVVRVCTGPLVIWNSVPETQVRQGHAQVLSVMPIAGAMFSWYEGPAGDVAGSQLITTTSSHWRDVYTTEDTTYWVRATVGACYADLSVAVRVCIPTITAQPQPVPPVNPSDEVQLSVVANGGTLSYQWYLGERGNISQPIPNATAATLTYRPAATVTVWVRITNLACGTSADSNAVVIDVCAELRILGTSAPIAQRGATAVMTLSHYGSAPFTYRWYQGALGNTASLVSSAVSFNVVAQETTDYWIRVTDACGNVQDSSAKLSVYPVFATQPQSRSITSGTTATLAVGVEGTQLGYQWYEGQAGVITTPVGTNAPTFTTPALIAERSYWVRVSSGNAVMDSEAAVISICPPPIVTVENTQVSGAPVRLSVAGGAQPDHSYAWYRGNPGDTSTPVGIGALVTVAPTQSTTYWLRQSNASCTADSEPIVVVICKPAITQQPAGSMINPGASATLTVAATGNPTLTYQWYVSGGAAVNGATSATFQPSPASTTSYYARVTNGTGPAGTCSVDSAPATVQVCVPPSITAQAQPAIISRGAQTTLQVSASGTSLGYQWYQGASGITTTPVSGATAATLNVSPSLTTDYWVKVTGTCGSVNGGTVRVSVRPLLTAQPASVRVTSGSTATFSVGVDGNLLSYQWYRGTAPDTSVPVGTAAAYTTPALTADTSYWVRVFSGSASTESATATASVCAPPILSINNPYNTSGASVTLSVTNGIAGDTYRWYRGNTGDTSILVADTGTTAAVTVSPLQTTTYWVRATSATCYANSASTTVTVCNPAITVQPQGSSITAGQAATLSVTATGTSLSYQWYAGAVGTTSSPVAGGASASISVTPSATTSYWVRITSSAGCAKNSTGATVNVCTPPSITQQPISDPAVSAGGVQGLRVTAAGTGLTYQWYRGQSGDTAQPVFTNTHNPVFNAQSTAYYWVRVSNGCGSVNSAAVLASVHPQITAHPQSIAITRGTGTTLSVASNGTYLAYQWYRGVYPETAVPVGSNATTYTTPALTADTSYWVRVTSGSGYASSQTATVAMCASPSIAVNNPSQISGSNVTLSIDNPTGTDTYRWYRGNSGDTSTLLAESTATSMIVAPTVTTNYWVRALRSSCHADSATVTVTICYPRITAQPANASIVEGQSATLSVAATGNAPLTYQWYAGAAGVTSNPVAGGTGATLTVTPVVTTSYWVQVRSGCSVNSVAATVNVCNTPKITTQPAACWGLPGYGCQLKVVASGTGLTYQWYAGASGDLSRPVNGKTADTLTLANAQTEYYWVRVSNSCGSVNSISVPMSIKPTIHAHPAAVQLSSGASATFTVVASGTYLSYQWMRSDGVTVGTNSPTLVIPSVTTTAYAYSCIVTSATAQSYSNYAGVEFCDGPVIFSGPSASPNGSCKYLQVSANDYYGWFTYQWFRGSRGDMSTPVGNGSSVNVCQSGTYWCRVTDGETGCYTDTQTVAIP